LSGFVQQIVEGHEFLPMIEARALIKSLEVPRGLLSRTAAPTLLQVSGFSPPIANMFFEDVKFTIFFGLLLANPSYEAELGA
jgi:hypothetical protein